MVFGFSTPKHSYIRDKPVYESDKNEIRRQEAIRNTAAEMYANSVPGMKLRQQAHWDAMKSGKPKPKDISNDIDWGNKALLQQPLPVRRQVLKAAEIEYKRNNPPLVGKPNIQKGAKKALKIYGPKK